MSTEPSEWTIRDNTFSNVKLSEPEPDYITKPLREFVMDDAMMAWLERSGAPGFMLQRARAALRSARWSALRRKHTEPYAE